MITRRKGIGLPAVVAVLMVSAVAAAGVVTVALQRRLDAHDAARWVHTSAAAESAVRIALAHWSADIMRSIPPGTTAPLAAAAAPAGSRVVRSATAERVGRSQYLVRGVAQIRAAGFATARANALAMVVMVPVDDVWRDFFAVVASAGGVTLGATSEVSGIDAGVPLSWSASDCPTGFIARITSLLGGADVTGVALPAGPPPTATTGSAVKGVPPVWLGAPLTGAADFSRLGPLSLRDVAAIADRIESGSVSLTPASTGGSCDRTAAGNWGNPTDRADPCFDWVPLVFSPSGLEVVGGTGQGVLVVDGDVSLRAGVGFHGAVLATGQVDVDGARVIGAVRAGAGVRIEGTVAHSACVISRIFDRTHAFRKPFRQGDRLWLPTF